MNTWFITGCSRGLGRGIAEAALRRGEQVAVTARLPEKVEALAKAYPERALALRLDLNDKAGVERAVQDACDRFGKIDVLVNNAGHGYRAAIEESEPEQVEELFNTNFFAPMELIRMVLPKMRARRKGMIVNVTSIGAVRGALGNGYYSAAKGALELATEALAKEVKHLGIRTMLVEPGAFRTSFYDEGLKGSGASIADYDVLAAQYRKGNAVNLRNQPGDPEKGGEIIVETALREDAPFRLLLGSDAVRAAETELEHRPTELRAWAGVSARSDFQR